MQTFEHISTVQIFSGFDGKDLTPGAHIELNPEDCLLSTSTNQPKPSHSSISYNPTNNSIVLENIIINKVILFDAMGRKVFQKSTSASQVELPLLKTGLYFVNANHWKGVFSSSIFIH